MGALVEGGGRELRGLAGQRVEVPFALLAGNAGSVGVRGQLSRSRISPSEQVGSQIEGGFGWRALGDSGGISAPAGGGGGVEFVAQPTSRQALTAHSISRSGKAGCGFTVGVLLPREAALRFLGGGFGGLSVAPLPCGALGGGADATLVIAPRKVAEDQRAGQGGQQRDADDRQARDHGAGGSPLTAFCSMGLVSITPASASR